MDYKGMIPPFELAYFEEMNKKQVKQYFNWFMETKEERLNNLQNYIWNDTKDVILDKTPESLIKLWTWFQKKIEWEEKTEQELQEDIARHPEWMKEHILEDIKKCQI